ncbi:MAG: zinc-ribbon domain containing protein [Roseiflexaceae bacterium]|nr:zinc-ribbon domain containing protein [Roseiflexaceae bacterium]
MSYADKTLACRDCGTEFVFTAGEQEFYAQKGFTNEPTRCPSCRQARKAGGGSGGGAGRSRDSYGERDSYGGGGGGSSYGERDSYSGGGGGGSYSSRGGAGGGFGGGAPREMHTTTCASCGNQAQVPFVPRGDKPVLCSDCFQAQRRSSSGGSRW